VLLSNKWRDGLRGKYKLLNLVRTQNNSEEAFHAVYQDEVSGCTPPPQTTPFSFADVLRKVR
jgi:hypothetical protein